MKPGHGDGADAGFPSRGRARRGALLQRTALLEQMDTWAPPVTEVVPFDDVHRGDVILREGMEALVVRISLRHLYYRYLHEPADAQVWSSGHLADGSPIRLVTSTLKKEAR